MEVTAFHRNLIRSSLWPYSSPHGGRPLTVILLYGVRTFLPPRCDQPELQRSQRLSWLTSCGIVAHGAIEDRPFNRTGGVVQAGFLLRYYFSRK